MGPQTWLSGSREEPVPASCWHSTKPADFAKCRQFLEQLRNW